MPYTKQEIRNMIDNAVNHLIEDIRATNSNPELRDGTCNYAITRTVLASMRPQTGWTYHTLSNAIKVFQDAHDESKRRLLSYLEDTKVRENGDLLEFQEEFTK